jgi:uncharacterized protein (TIGR02391 family)
VARHLLDDKLVGKLAKRLDKPDTKAINVMVSKLAHKLGIASQAALIVLAKQNGIGTAVYQRSLDAAMQAQVRDALPSIFLSSNAQPRRASGRKSVGYKNVSSKKASLRLAIEYLIHDPILLDRCQDLLMAPSNFDRAINQATQILEDRIRKKAAPSKKLTGESLVGFAFNEDLLKTVLRVESGDPDDQRGFTQILRGIVPAFRNKTHHHITDSLSREEAMRVVGFIDVLLRVVDKSAKAEI